MSVCIYCKQENKLSNEHLISSVALKEFYGDPVINIVHTKRSGRWKHLPNNEQTIKDVCIDCNSKLSDFGYDRAGLQFLKDINACVPADTLSIRFNNETINWLIKTHLNNFRQTPILKNLKIIVNEDLYFSLINNQIIDTTLYSLLMETIVIKGDLWGQGQKRLSSIYNGTGLLNDKIAFSEIRFKYLDTFLILPLNGKYETFSTDLENGKLALNLLMHPYAKSVDVKISLVAGSLFLNKDFPFLEYIKGLVNIRDYESIFS